MENGYTYIEEGNVFVCNDCGAFASSEGEVNHHETCKPGESKEWEDFYNEEEEVIHNESMLYRT